MSTFPIQSLIQKSWIIKKSSINRNKLISVEQIKNDSKARVPLPETIAMVNNSRATAANQAKAPRLDRNPTKGGARVTRKTSPVSTFIFAPDAQPISTVSANPMKPTRAGQRKPFIPFTPTASGFSDFEMTSGNHGFFPRTGKEAHKF